MTSSHLRRRLVEILLALPAGYVYGTGDSKYLRTGRGDVKRTPEVEELMAHGLACRGLRGVPDYPVVPTDRGLVEIDRLMNGAST
jgi:hypothetical protein